MPMSSLQPATKTWGPPCTMSEHLREPGIVDWVLGALLSLSDWAVHFWCNIADIIEEFWPFSWKLEQLGCVGWLGLIDFFFLRCRPVSIFVFWLVEASADCCFINGFPSSQFTA